MKYIFILFALLFSFNCQSQSLQQQINILRQDIYRLKNKVDSLQNLNYLCCCQNKLYLIEASGIFWWEDQTPERLYLDDRLPTDEPCNGAKAILLTNDATLYLIYIPEGDGWVIYKAAYGGLNQ